MSQKPGSGNSHRATASTVAVNAEPLLRVRPRQPAPKSPTFAVAQDDLVDTLRNTLLTLVRRDGRDLTARQLTAFLAIYTQDTTLTVSSLAEMMNISRPGVTRVMDRLVHFDLISREEDREDRRRVLARRTARGAAFYRELVAIARLAANGGDQGSFDTHDIAATG
jgi:DNA-binding MarR family transcriptional regulator